MSLQSVALVLTVGILGVLGSLCVFRPLVVAQFAQRTYPRNRLPRAWPFSNFSNVVLKPWYLTYLRCMGVFMWVFAALLILALFTGNGD